MGRKEEQYEVESIIGKRRKKGSGSIQYRVLWKGWSKEDATWEPEEHLENVQEMIDDFNRKLEQRNSPRVSPVQTTIQKKTSEPIINQNEKNTLQKSTRKTAKQSDDEAPEDYEPQTEGPKSPPISANRNRSQKIQEETPIKPPEKKNVPPPIKNGVKPLNESAQMKRLTSKSIENEEEGSDQDEERNSILQVTGMFIGEDGKYEFTVHEKKFNRRVTLKRSEVLKKDPVSLVRFYERNLNASA